MPLLTRTDVLAINKIFGRVREPKMIITKTIAIVMGCYPNHSATHFCRFWRTDGAGWAGTRHLGSREALTYTHLMTYVYTDIRN